MYLRNGWYCAGWAAELGEAPIGRRMLSEPVMVYRSASGEPVALEGRCPHRFAPLHLGTVANDTVACPYHGLVFDRSGSCVHNPHGDVPQDAKLKTYPVAERDGIVWVWMGDPAKADPELIIDGGFVVDPSYATVLGYLNVAAHYQMVIDNLLDLTHPAIVHKGGLSSEEYMGENMRHRFQQDGTTIHSDYSFLNVNPSPGLAPLWGDRKTDVRAFMTLYAPTNLVLDFRMNEVDGPMDEGVFLPTLHLLVPENEERTHYFYAMGRNVEVDNEELSAITAKMARHAFEDEDEPMIRACQDMMGTTDLFSLKPVLLKTDVAAVRARILLEKLIARETAEAEGMPVLAGNHPGMILPAQDLADLQQLAARYWALADLIEGVPLAALFEPDAAFELGSLKLEGLSAIEEFFTRRAEGMRTDARTTRHVATNFLALPEDRDRVRTRSTVLVFAANGELPLEAAAPSGIADFDDVCRRQSDGSWRYHYRYARTVFVGPNAASFAR